MLQVVGGMQYGGIENWLMELLRRLPRHEYAFDFLVHTDQRQVFDEEIARLGGRVLSCPHPHAPWRYARDFRRVLARHGPYDAIHSHMGHYSGFVLRLAAQAGIRQRLAHGHSDSRTAIAGASRWRRGYVALMRRWIRQYSTQTLACSREACQSLVGMGHEHRGQVLYCGIDLQSFEASGDRRAVRAALGIPAHRKVVGHVGVLCPEKNHALLLEVAATLKARRPDVHFLFVGDGDLRASIRAAVEKRGLQSDVTLAGGRGDVRDILLGAIDVFAFPSTSEGLPLAVVEAQAAGLPIVLSTAVTPEVEVVSELVVRRSPVAGASRWADAISDALDQPPAVGPLEARRRIAASPFAIEHSLAALLQIYRGDETARMPPACSPRSHHAHENS